MEPSTPLSQLSRGELWQAIVEGHLWPSILLQTCHVPSGYVKIAIENGHL